MEKFTKTLKARFFIFLNDCRDWGPGVLICVTIATAAQFLAQHYGAPQMLFALLLGMAFHFLSEEGPCRTGIYYSANTLLRFGVALRYKPSPSPRVLSFSATH